MENYEKALLYAYPALEGVIDAFDAVFLKRALDSYASGRTALLEAERLIEKIAEKDLYISLKLKLDRILEKFTPYERKHFSYKYFKDLPAEEYENFDAVAGVFPPPAEAASEIRKGARTRGADRGMVRPNVHEDGSVPGAAAADRRARTERMSV